MVVPEIRNTLGWIQYYVKNFLLILTIIQKRFTKCLNGLQSDPYAVRIRKLSLDSLELRRLRFYIVMIFNIIHGFVEMDITNLLHFYTSNGNMGNLFNLVKTNCKTGPE